ncbi:ABC transporter substrate-binding protein [Ectothiorhodospiraceae bacterium WFHF3C12]|nr:ABC transporter substrate-binding protein [Ectothiorhodospiraceae bacterium WFHF3C12]
MATEQANPDANGPLETRELRLGIIPLTDCAPLVVARELGFFAEQGLDVTLSREASWANIRDKVQLGALDGAQMLGPMPLAGSLGVAGPRKPMVTAFNLSLNGNAITVSRRLHERMCRRDPRAMAQRPVTAEALRQIIETDRLAGAPPLTFAMVFPVSNHNYQLRYWLASAGIDPDRDVRIIVIPPQFVASNLECGRIDGFCVGEPWNSYAVSRGIGCSLITSYEIWNNGPEKVFAVTEEWAARHPATHRAVLLALLRACRWLDEPDNRRTAARLLARPEYVGVPESVLTPTLVGRFRDGLDNTVRYLPDFMVFSRYGANFPWRSHGLWFGLQMMRWGQIGDYSELEGAVQRTYRPDIYRDAAEAAGLSVPEKDWKTEGLHAQEWLLKAARYPIRMATDRFFDGRAYDPADPHRYLGGFRIGRRPRRAGG